MGNTNLQNSDFWGSQYTIVGERFNDWSGSYYLVQDYTRKIKAIKKVIVMRSHQEAKKFVDEARQQQSTQFYILNPLHIELEDESRFCSLTQTINVFHKALLPSAVNKIQKSKQTFKESEILFILSEISHSLQILQERSHPHLWISPMTIYYNSNSNWFLHDLTTWRGTDYQSLINSKFQSKELMSDYLKIRISRGEYINTSLAFDEDIYCLGYAILYMMTGYSQFQIKQNLHSVFGELAKRYSEKLINLVRSMIQQNVGRRMTIQKLSHQIKIEQETIIKQEMADYKRQLRKKSNSQRNPLQNQMKYNKNTHTNSDYQETPLSLPTTIHNSPFLNPNIAQYSDDTKNRRSNIYLSPPSHRLNHSPVMQDNRRITTQFRFNSPHR